MGTPFARRCDPQLAPQRNYLKPSHKSHSKVSSRPKRRTTGFYIIPASFCWCPPSPLLPPRQKRLLVNSYVRKKRTAADFVYFDPLVSRPASRAPPEIRKGIFSFQSRCRRTYARTRITPRKLSYIISSYLEVAFPALFFFAQYIKQTTPRSEKPLTALKL